MFITLSCAEYFWPDIKRLLKERFELVGLEAPDIEEDYVKLVNDYTLIIQEYFQKRVEIWLETIGKTIFKIKHYWGRFEFAPSRGQIHLHFLAITEMLEIYKKLYEYRNDKKKQAQILQQWVEGQLRMTASLPDLSDQKKPAKKNSANHPSNFYYSDKENLYQDSIDCLLHMQQHVCSSYCLRKRKYTEKKESKESKCRRVCRSGAGVEITANSNVTPGFTKISMPKISKDLRGFNRLDLPRNSTRTVQTSLWLAQGWRANCDIQIILYDSDPECPDPKEVGKVTDYVVAYACKGNETLLQEKKEIKNLIQNAESVTDCKKDIKRLARQILNKTVAKKLISKQEVMVQLAKLNLTTCSESIETVSLSGSYKLSYQ